LATGFALKCSGAERAAVGAGAVPLGEGSAGGRAEDSYAHICECNVCEYLWDNSTLSEDHWLVTPPSSRSIGITELAKKLAQIVPYQ